MTLLPVLPLQTGDEHQKARRDRLIQEGLIHGPELLPEMILILPIKRRSIGPYRAGSTVIRVRPWLLRHACAVHHQPPYPTVPFYEGFKGRPTRAEALGLQAEIASEGRRRDLGAMRDNTDSELIDIGGLRLERAIRRFEQEDHEGGLEDLRAALHHMRWVGADPLSVQYLASVISDAERKASWTAHGNKGSEGFSAS